MESLPQPQRFFFPAERKKNEFILFGPIYTSLTVEMGVQTVSPAYTSSPLA